MGTLNVLYEDNHIIVVIKPPNVLTQGDNTGDESLLEQVREYIRVKYHKPGNVYVGLVHRLDRPVGGILVFARTSKAAARLSEAIRKNEIDRKYLAVVHGEPKEQEVLVHWLKKDEKTNMVSASHSEISGSKRAELEYRKIRSKGTLSLLEVTLHTGRAHQIRVQLATSGYPIYGDMRYGKQEKGQITLWCYRLGLTHPTKKEWMEWEATPDYPPFTEI